MLTPKELAMEAVKALDEKKAGDIRLLKVNDVTSIADYFVICTANSTTQIKSLADIAEAKLEEMGEKLIHREGFRSGGWVLLDYGCIIVHIFMDETRKFYNLERLWSDAAEEDISGIISEN